MKRIMSLIIILLISLSTIAFADLNTNQLELDAVLLNSVDSIDDITKSNKNASFNIKEFDFNEKILIGGYIVNEEFSEYLEITGDPYHSYYNEGDVVIDAKSSNPNWSIEHFISFKNIPSNKILFNENIRTNRVIQIILKNKSTNEIIIIEDAFKKLSQNSDKLVTSKVKDPFLEHWWTRILLPSNSQTEDPSITRNSDVDFDSFYSSRYDLGSSYWAEYYIKVEQTLRYYDLSSVGSNSTDYLGLTIVEENTTTNYWGIDDLNDTPLIIKNARGEYKISTSSGNEINDEFINTKWGGYYHDRSSVDFSISASVAKIIGVSLSYSPISNIQIEDDYLIPTSFGPIGGFKISYPGYLDKEGDQYNMEVVKERSGVKTTNYYMQGSFYFDYAIDSLGSPLSSGSTFTIGEYE